MHERYASVFRKIGIPFRLDLDKSIYKKQEIPNALKTVYLSGKKIIGVAPFAQFNEKMYPIEKMKILVIDSEGIGAFDEDVNHDTKIFLLALLLSSNFIFNSMNTIDENAINSLSLIINLSKEL
jgi:hypothetical protein